MLSIQKSPLDKTGLGLKIASLCLRLIPQTLFLLLSLPISEIVKLVEVTPPRKIRVDLKESKPKNSTLSKDKLYNRPAWVCHFCGKFGHIRPNYFKLQAAKRANKLKVPVPQAQNPVVLIGELVKGLNFYSNLGVGHYSNVNNKSNTRIASKKFLMQHAQSN